MATKLTDDKLREARAEAVRQLVNRERRDGLHAMHDHLWRAVGWRNNLDDPNLTFADFDDESRRLVEENNRILAELGAYDHQVHRGGVDELVAHHGIKRCALVGEDIANARRRILLELGASSYQVAALDIAESGNIASSAARKAADRAKRQRRDRLLGEVAEIASRLAALRRFLAIWPRFKERVSDPQVDIDRLEARRNELQASIEGLSIDRKAPAKRKSSSRKRR